MLAAALLTGLAGPALALTATTTTLTVKAGGAATTSVAAGTTVTLTATVVAGSTAVTKGIVNFCDATVSYCTDIHLYGSVPLNGSGMAVLRFKPAPGGHSYKAVFAPTTTYATSTSSTAALAVQVPTSTTIAQSGSTGNYTLTSTVTGTSSTIAPTGTVGFQDTGHSNYQVASASLVAGTNSFSLNSTTPGGAASTSQIIATGDFNNDGIADIASGGLTLNILLGNGDGTFTSKPSITVLGGDVAALAVGDFNGDGIVDIGESSELTPGSVTIFLGNGDGTFTTKATFTFDSVSYADTLLVADFNGDGIQDMVLSGTSDNSVGIMLGNGDGTFTTSTISLGQQMQTLNVGDFNADGKPDLIILELYGLAVYTSNGNGTFTMSGSLFGPTQQEGVAVADLNGDGKPDLLVTGGYYGSEIYIYNGNGNGTFTGGNNLNPNFSDPDLTVLDLNGDGLPDIFTGYYNNSYYGYYLGQSGGGFGGFSYAPVPGGGDLHQIAVADINGDGVPDVLATNSGGFNFFEPVLSANATATATGVALTGTGTHNVKAAFLGSANFAASASSGTVALTGATVSSSVAVTYSPTTRVGAGDPVTLTATVSPSSSQGYTPTGTATFYYGSTNLGMGTVTNGVGSVITTALPAGTDAVYAVYSGDTSFAGSTSPNVSIPVLPAPTVTLTVKSGSTAVTSVTVGTIVTLTATVTSGASAVTKGIVNFCDASVTYCTDLHLLGSVALNSSGTATIKLKPGAGGRSYRAMFQGTASLGITSSATSTLAVTSENTATTIAQSGSAGNYTLTASVTNPVNGNAPSGTVVFKDTTNSNFALASATISGSSSTFGYTSPVAYTAASNPGVVVTGDFNKDGYQDQAVVNSGSGNVTIFLGNGDGTFTFKTNVNTLGSSPAGMATGDFNGDGILDLAVSDPNNGVTVLLGNGDGTFTLHNSQVSGNVSKGSCVAAGDFNGDGFTDLATCFSISGYGNGLEIYISNGDGTFTDRNTLSLAGGPIAVVSGDFNNDGLADLAVSDSTGAQAVELSTGVSYGFTAVPFQALNQAASLAIGDFNGDGKLDLVSASTNYGFFIYLGGGDGTLTKVKQVSELDNAVYATAVGDFNGDGKLDIVSLGYPIAYYLGNGSGSFTLSLPYPNYYADYNEYGVAAADFNNDGVTDAVFTRSDTGTTNVMLSTVTTTATATATGVAATGTGTHNVLAAYPGDTYFNASNSATTALTASGAVTTLTLTASPGSISYGQSATLTATLSPTTSQGHTATGTVTFSSGSTMLGTGTLNSSGVATYTGTNLPQGNDSLTAVYAGDTNFATETSNTLPYTVSAALTGFKVTGIPANATAATGYSFTVTAVGSGGTVTTGYYGTVTLSSTDTTATISPQTYTFTAADAGVHTFVATFNTSGTWSVTATAGSATGSETGIVVTGNYIWLLNANGTTEKVSTSGSGVAGSGSASGSASKGSLAFDSAGDIWSVTKPTNALNFATRTGSGATSYTGGGLNAPVAVAVDGAGYIWIANSGVATVSSFKNSGAAQSGTSGYGSAAIGSYPSAVAIDSTGGVWVTAASGNSVTHIFGAAAPVASPLSSDVKNNTLGTRP